MDSAMKAIVCGAVGDTNYIDEMILLTAKERLLIFYEKFSVFMSFPFFLILLANFPFFSNIKKQAIQKIN